MKKLFLTLTTLALTIAMNAQNQFLTTNLEAKEHVEETTELNESISEVYGIMVCRLNEEASASYQSGSAEVSYADLKDRVIASTQEHNFTNDNETVTLVTGPSVSALDDNHGSQPPALLENESALDYLNRLEQLTKEAIGHEEFLVIATTGGESGIVYTRVQANGTSLDINKIESEEKYSLSLFPNPSINQITISGLPSGNYPAQILDASGKVVLEVAVSENEQLAINNLSQGLYTLRVLVDDKFQMEKFQVVK